MLPETLAPDDLLWRCGMRGLILISLLAALADCGAAHGALQWREQVVLKAGYGEADSLFGRAQLNGFCVGENEIFVMDGLRDEIKVFGHDGHFKRTLRVSWPDTAVFQPRLSRVYSDMVVVQGTIYVLAFCGVRPVDQHLRDRFTAYQLLAYSSDTGKLKAYYLIPDSVAKALGKPRSTLGSSDFGVLMVRGAELGIANIFQDKYQPLMKDGRWIRGQVFPSVMEGVPFDGGWLRNASQGESVEILDASKALQKRLEGIHASWVAKNGRFFLRSVTEGPAWKILRDGDLSTSVMEVYGHGGEPIGQVKIEVVVGSCRGFAEPLQAKASTVFGPDGCLYIIGACFDGVTLRRWCPE